MPNKVLLTSETAITFKNTGGDAVLTLTSLGSGAGRISARYDKGAGAKWKKARIIFKTKSATQTVKGEHYRIHIVPSNGTVQANNLGSSDAAVSDVDDTLNLPEALVAVIYDASATPESCVYAGVCYIPWRYFSLLVWNASADGLSATAGDHEIILEPIVDEIQ